MAAQPPAAERRREARSRGLADRSGRGRRERLQLRLVKADQDRPSWIATVAGMAPGSRTAASEARATSRFWRVRQAVADQRRFEGDDGAAVGERRGDLGRDDEAVGTQAVKRSHRPCHDVAPAGRTPARTPVATLIADGRPIRAAR